MHIIIVYVMYVGQTTVSMCSRYVHIICMYVCMYVCMCECVCMYLCIILYLCHLCEYVGV